MLARLCCSLDKIERAIDAIIAVDGTIVKEFDTRNWHRKVAARICLAGLLHPECEKAMWAQAKTWEGLSGPRASA